MPDWRRRNQKTLAAQEARAAAQLTIVFTAPAVSHAIQSRTGLAIAKTVKQLRPLRSAAVAAELDAKRAIKQGTELAARL